MRTANAVVRGHTMYQVIARKYRPQSFAELLGQEHVRTTLENAITQKRIAHGYIFSGQRGTGKTTVARIMARCLNCEQGPTPNPCGKCASCTEIASGSAMDVIEIDAALQSRHQRNARAARKRPLPPGPRPLQNLHRRRSTSDSRTKPSTRCSRPSKSRPSGPSSSSVQPNHTKSRRRLPRAASSSAFAPSISPCWLSVCSGSSRKRASRPTTKR